MSTDAIELTAFFASAISTIFSVWILRKHWKALRLIEEHPEVRDNALRYIAMGIFHSLKPLVFLVVFGWCLFLREGPPQAAIKNAGVTIVVILLMARSLYEYSDFAGFRPWTGFDRRKRGGESVDVERRRA